MKVVVRQKARALYLREDGHWAASRREAAEFESIPQAVIVCIRAGARNIKLVGKNEAGANVCFYPFGGDPVARAEAKKLRRRIQESARLKREMRMIEARIDSLLAEAKEEKHRSPVKRRDIEEAE
jgi:hypothetical protein